MNRKLYTCNECQILVPIRSKGLCKMCRYKQKGSQVKQYTIKRQTDKNKIKKQNKREILEPFYKYHIEKVAQNPYCMNCGCRIQGNLNNLAHLLPKRFGGNPELMGELDNCLYLCASVNGGQEIGCHEKMDRIQGSSQFYLMPCFKKALEHYLTFRNKVVKYNKYVEIFEDYIKEQNEGTLS